MHALRTSVLMKSRMEELIGESCANSGMMDR